MSFDTHPTVYWAIGIALMCINAIVILLPNTKYQIALRIVLGVVLLWYMRLPALVFNQELNIDESQMIGNALTLNVEPTYWKSVDGTTIGPLDIYALIVPSWLGFGFDYTSARLLAVLFIMGALLFFRQTLFNFFGETVASVGWLPPLFLLAFTQDPDFVHYSSEQLPVFLLSGSLWILSYLTKTQKQAHWGWFLALGFVLGLLPFAKLQSIPQGFILGAWGLWLAYQKRPFLGRMLALMSGAVSFSLMTLLLVLRYQLWDDFVDFYIKGNLIYAGGGQMIGIIKQAITIFQISQDFFISVLSMIAMGVVGIFFRRLSISKPHFVCAVLYLLSSIYAVTKSGNVFAHYLNFCIYPFAFLSAFLISNLAKKNYAFVLAVLAATPVFVIQGIKVIRHEPLNRFVSTTGHTLPQSEVTKLIKKYARADEYLAVWGWMCKYYVETKMPQATAESHSTRCVFQHPLQRTYYTRYLRNLTQNRPKVFVDAVGPNSLWLNDRATQSHEQFAELKQLIQTNYTFVGEVEHTRVYVR
nr:hypothetical protein [Spirosomataceae bacterium]